MSTPSTPNPAGSENPTGPETSGEFPAGITARPDRRGYAKGPDRRSGDRGSPTGLERRRGPGRRLSDFVKSAEEGEMNPEQFLFLMAIEEFKRANHKPYPSWTDVLEVVRLLGYRKTLASELTLRHGQDWTEAADAKANVRAPRWSEHAEDRRAA